MKRKLLILLNLAVGVAVALATGNASAQENLKTESRMPHLHHVALKDALGNPIEMPKSTTQPARANAYSLVGSCASCHEIGAISKGWHFSAGREGVAAGRAGEPWILYDSATRTQIPISYRGWSGTFKPYDIGETRIRDNDPNAERKMRVADDDVFFRRFSHHVPGLTPFAELADVKARATTKPSASTAATAAEQPALRDRLEIDCMLCHDADGHYAHDARYISTLQTDPPKLEQAPSVAMGLGTPGPGKTVNYDRSRFDAENKVSMKVTKSIPNDRCYYCHTSNTMLGHEKWMSDRDVHMRAGMLCVDCHRNGVDHLIVRGYEYEAQDRQVTADSIALRAFQLKRENLSLSDEQATAKACADLASEEKLTESLSCRGCHMGVEGAGKPSAEMGGRLGAPRPVHKGLPLVHLEKIACTTCHSGPFPEAQPQQVITALAHSLGLPKQLRAENTPPVIVEPVFLRGKDGKIAPHRMVWPSYWGRMNKDGAIRPMLPDEVKPVISEKSLIPDRSVEEMRRDPYDTRPLTAEQINKILGALAEDTSKDEPVFIAAGKLYRISNGKLTAAEHKAAAPYAWAFGHDVRPAKQAVGARSCQDCHSTNSPIYFGEVTARGAVAADAGVKKAMWELRGDNRTLNWLFAVSFIFRPMLKYIVFACAAVIAGVLLQYGLMGLGGIAARRRNQKNKA